MSKKKHNSIFDADAQTRRSIWRYPSHTTSMTRIKCLVATLCVLASFTSTAQEIQPLPGQGEVAQIGRFKHFKSTMLEGTWTGSLVMRQPNIPANKRDPSDDTDLEVKITIRDWKATVFLRSGTEWLPAMKDNFSALPLYANAIVHGFQFGTNLGQEWQENWVFSFTALDDNNALEEWSRVVNNLRVDESAELTKPAFSMAAVGKLTRIE